jgi:hypothetical protein
MRAIECDVCGELLTADDDEKLAERLRDHLGDEHDEKPELDEVEQTVDREAYDAVDS